MADKPLSALSLTELNKQRSTVKGLALILVLMWALLLGFSASLLLQKKAGIALLAIAISLIAVIIPLFAYLSKINIEIKTRNINKA